MNKSGKQNKILTIIGAILCVILIPMLIINCTLIVKSFINKEEVPDIGGIFPMIVLTDSMLPDIKSGDLIFCRDIDPDDVEEGMVISFFDPAGNGTSVVTHKVKEIIDNDDGSRSFRTIGTNNNTEDKKLVTEEDVIGRYTGVRIPGAGSVALFMQTPYGLILCVLLPFALIVGYDFLRRRKTEKEQSDDVASLKAELEKLRAMQNAEAAQTTEVQSEEVQNAECEMQNAEEAQPEEVQNTQA